MDNLPRTCGQKESSCRTSQGEAINTFLDNLEGFYGEKYNDTQRPVLMGYLMSIPPSVYDALYANVLRVKLYKRPLPLIDNFEEALEAVKAKQREYGEYKPLQLEAENCMPREEIAEGLARMMAQLESRVIRG